MRTHMVAGNWKMNGTAESIRKLIGALNADLDTAKNAQMVVCPPFAYLSQCQALLKESPIRLGAQNICDQSAAGAFTGEVAGFMLNDVGCQYVIVGHSERRSLYGESNLQVARKFATTQQAGLIPIFCVGETLAEREQGVTEEVIAKQLDAVIAHTGGVLQLQNAVVAYEPVWAIGTGKTASTEQAQQVHAFIRRRVAGHDAKIAESLRILYGGSVNAANAASLFAMPDIDGGLVGGAALQAADFLTIYRAAN